MMKIMSLFEGRHCMPDCVEAPILHNIHDITDINLMERQCRKSLKNCTELILFVTGLTPALVTVINYCVSKEIPCTLMNYDRTTGRYFRQDIVIPNTKPIKLPDEVKSLLV